MNGHLLILSHLLVFLPFLVLLSASPDPHPALVTLPSRSTPATRETQLPPLPAVEHDLLPYVIVSTIDGALHAVDRDGGKVRWTLTDGVEPLVGGGARGREGQEEYIVEPLSGSLYVFEDGEEVVRDHAPKVRKLPLSVEQLIELSPFTFPHSPSRIFTGSKSTSLLTIDLRTGQQLDCFASFSANLTDIREEEACVNENDRLLDDLEFRAPSTRDTLFVGRTDYRLTIHNPSASVVSSTSAIRGAELRRSPGVQEIVYSTYTPNSYDRPLADHWAKMGVVEQLWDVEGQVAKRMRVELGHDGVAVGIERGGGVRWITKLGSIGIAVYDILLPLSPASPNPILVPQPPPHLPSLFPPVHPPQSAHLDVHTRPPSTYIGTVPFSLVPSPSNVHSADDDNSSLHRTQRRADLDGPTADTRLSNRLSYALSSTAYPLINFAPPPRPGSFANGSFLLSKELPERDQLLPYLLDAAEEKGVIPISDSGDSTGPRRWRLWIYSMRDWRWWLLGVIGGITLFSIAFFGVSKREVSRHPILPAPEKTPLLAVPLEQNLVFKPVETPPLYGNSATSPETAAVNLTPTPKKKNTRRRVRGKKKRRDSSAALLEGEDGNDEDDGGEAGWSPPSTTERRGDKPLPDLPRDLSATDLLDMDDKERLSISDIVIGYGSHGTVVLKGTWGGRPVAVKRLLSDFTRLASQEVKLLQASDDHPNVIRYYCQERRDNFLYIALDLCQASLSDLIESPDKHLELASVLEPKKALAQVTAGLKHLHGMKIIHRDIKPQNVLVSQGTDRSLRLLVSDFGLARRLEQDQSSFAPTANNLAGSLGWRAPECIRGQVRLNDVFDRASSSSSSSASSSSSLLELAAEDEKDPRGRHPARLTKAVDLFALGCLYFWVLMGGEHPFGEIYDRESNIVKGDVVNMAQLEVLGEEGWEAKDLIGRLLAMNPTKRPDTSECLVHPFFWTPAKRLAFLCDASDRFEIMELEPPEATLVMLETNATFVVGRDWYSRLDKVFTNSLGKYRKYKGNSVRDLLRAMRNKKHHYQDLEPLVKRHLGALPAGFLHYFTSRYPSLFLHVHGVVRDSRLRHESMFEGYFHEGG